MIMNGNPLKMPLTTNGLLKLITFTNSLLGSTWNLMKYRDRLLAELHFLKLVKCLQRFGEKRAANMLCWGRRLLDLLKFLPLLIPRLLLIKQPIFSEKLKRSHMYGATTATNHATPPRPAGKSMGNQQIGRAASLETEIAVRCPLPMNEAETSPFNKEQINHLLKLLKSNSSYGILSVSLAQTGSELSVFACYVDSTPWIIDSGASDHMTSLPNLFSTYHVLALKKLELQMVVSHPLLEKV